VQACFWQYLLSPHAVSRHRGQWQVNIDGFITERASDECVDVDLDEKLVDEPLDDRVYDDMDDVADERLDEATDELGGEPRYRPSGRTGVGPVEAPAGVAGAPA
jgi:hypothetical protein